MNEPQKLDYHGPETLAPSWTRWFWSGLWSEIRSELADVPLWLLVPFVGLVMAVLAGLLYIALAITLGVFA
jgi:hypothetical protein